MPEKLTISYATVADLVNSKDQFPVNFDDAWRWIGYSNKGNAEAALRSLLREGSDFLCESIKNGDKGRPYNAITLTTDAFKHFAMAAKTEQGYKVRDYFIECEKKLWANLKEVTKILDELGPGQPLIDGETQWRQEHKQSFIDTHTQLEDADTRARELYLIVQGFLAQANQELELCNHQERKAKEQARERLQLVNRHLFKIHTLVNWAFAKLDSYKGNYL